MPGLWDEKERALELLHVKGVELSEIEVTLSRLEDAEKHLAIRRAEMLSARQLVMRDQALLSDVLGLNVGSEPKPKVLPVGEVEIDLSLGRIRELFPEPPAQASLSLVSMLVRVVDVLSAAKADGVTLRVTAPHFREILRLPPSNSANLANALVRLQSPKLSPAGKKVPHPFGTGCLCTLYLIK